MSGKKILRTPISPDDLADLRIGDIVYLTGHIVTCRDVAHRRLIEYGRELPVDLRDGAIIHAGPIVRKIAGSQDKYEMVSIGPTTSSRMEKFEKDFIRETGVRLIVGKGGMGADTRDACREYKAVHCVYPAGCAVLAATQVEEIERQEWTDLGMPETLWVCRVREFGPLIVSIDTHGGNLFEENKVLFNQRKDEACAEIVKQVGFIK
ncbi:MAG: L(+)-tartrate dehydratase subunit beta [Clostridia bacterium]|nr:L(+)-tartrate dehydratase subunit beta [Clostridia bacterium]